MVTVGQKCAFPIASGGQLECYNTCFGPILRPFWAIWTPCTPQKRLEGPEIYKPVHSNKIWQKDQEVTGDDSEIGPEVAHEGTKVCQSAQK